jgi:hypothetical protein
MGGGLMQLVAYGAQDIYLTGNPQITFFKVVYRKHTNFSMESIKQTFSGTADFGRSVTATISRNGDLVHRMYLEHDGSFTVKDVAQNNEQSHQLSIVERYGDSLIKECEIEIGGQKIDKHTSMWNRVYSDLTEFNPSGYFGPNPPGPADGTLYQKMTGNAYGFNTGDWSAIGNSFGMHHASSAPPTSTINGISYTRGDGGSTGSAAKVSVNKIFLPLNFWFNRNPGLALPLIALQYHEVKVKMTFESLGNLSRIGVEQRVDRFNFAEPSTSGDVDTTGKFDLWCDYIYLDTYERRRFAQVSHEYLIEQLQYSKTNISSANPSIDLNFNHPVKELVWCMRNETAAENTGRHCTPSHATGDATSGPTSIDKMGGNWQLKLNGHGRFKERDTKYFTRTQVWQHHTGYGGVPTAGLAGIQLNYSVGANHPILGYDSIAVYSFALKPEEHQPSGTCNFSRIDNAQLVGSGVTVAQGRTQTQAPAGMPTTKNIKLTIFAVNYNVLRIMSGMGGLAYSN